MDLSGVSPMCIVADACVFIDFLKAGQVELIGKHPSHFISTQQIREEVKYVDQKERYQNAINSKYFEQTQLQNINEKQMYVNLSRDTGRYPEITIEDVQIFSEGPLGFGESSAISVACYRGYRLATDDELARQRAEMILLGPGRVLGTADIADELSQNKLLTDVEARKLFGKRFRQRENRRTRTSTGRDQG